MDQFCDDDHGRNGHRHASKETLYILLEKSKLNFSGQFRGAIPDGSKFPAEISISSL